MGTTTPVTLRAGGLRLPHFGGSEAPTERNITLFQSVDWIDPRACAHVDLDLIKIDLICVAHDCPLERPYKRFCIRQHLSLAGHPKRISLRMPDALKKMI